MRLQGARTVITGATGGIGSRVAETLAERGAELLLVARDRGALAGLARALGPTARILSADLTDPGDTRAVIAQALDQLGGIDLLVNVAGGQRFACLTQIDPAEIERLVRINLLAPMLLARAALPPMLAAGGGQIVNVGSALGAIGLPCFTAYGAGKAGLQRFSEALRRELAGTPVTVHHVAPRATRTGLNSAALYRMGEATGMRVDPPERVAARIIEVIESGVSEAYIGWPERLLVRVNALVPRLVDAALRKQGRVMTRHARAARVD